MGLFTSSTGLTLTTRVRLISMSTMGRFEYKGLNMVKVRTLNTTTRFLITGRRQLITSRRRQNGSVRFKRPITRSLRIFLFRLPKTPLIRSLMKLNNILHPSSNNINNRTYRIILRCLLRSLSTARRNSRRGRTPRRTRTHRRATTLIPHSNIRGLFVYVWVWSRGGGL